VAESGRYRSQFCNNVVARNPSKDKLIGLAKGLGVSEESRRVGIAVACGGRFGVRGLVAAF